MLATQNLLANYVCLPLRTNSTQLTHTSLYAILTDLTTVKKTSICFEIPGSPAIFSRVPRLYVPLGRYAKSMFRAIITLVCTKLVYAASVLGIEDCTKPSIS